MITSKEQYIDIVEGRGDVPAHSEIYKDDSAIAFVAQGHLEKERDNFAFQKRTSKAIGELTEICQKLTGLSDSSIELIGKTDKSVSELYEDIEQLRSDLFLARLGLLILAFVSVVLGILGIVL